MTAKLSFRKWIALEEAKITIQKSVESSEFPDRIFDYLSTAFDSVNENEPWENSVLSFSKALSDFQPKKIPLLTSSPKKEKPIPWDYEGRSWAYWSHILAKAYGWTLEYIAELDMDEALARVQEILADEQLDREFTYSLSEIAYPYNSSTKKSIYKPMPRPFWMKDSVPPVKAFRFERNLLPVGLVEDISGMPASMNPLRDTVVYKNQKKTEETQSPRSP